MHLGVSYNGNVSLFTPLCGKEMVVVWLQRKTDLARQFTRYRKYGRIHVAA